MSVLKFMKKDYNFYLIGEKAIKYFDDNSLFVEK